MATKSNAQRDAEAAQKRQQALTDAQASGDPAAIAAAQAEIDTSIAASEDEADGAAEEAAQAQEDAAAAAAEATRKQAAAESAAFQARAQASTESLLAADPGRQVSYLPTQVVYRAAPTIEPAKFRQVTSKGGHVTNEGIGSKET